MKQCSNYIGGQWMPSADGELLYSENPTNYEEIVGSLPKSTDEDIHRAVTAAHSASLQWRELSGGVRGEFLYKAANLLEARVDELADMMTREMGKTLPEARGEALRAVAILKYYAAQGNHSNGEHIPSSDGKSILYTKRIPIGVVGLVTPWNFPVAIPIWKMAPALVCGNTIVLKPAQNTSVTASLLFEILAEAGFPDGVINIVHGSGSSIGHALVQHPLVHAISFTGSNQVGQQIASLAAIRGIKYQLEMGGKNAVIVLNDADVDKAVDLTISSAMKSTGQKCTATSKVIVTKEIKEQFVRKLVERVGKIRIGNGLNKDTYMGPLATRRQQLTVLEHIQKGIEQGAELLLGGRVPQDPELAMGYYVMPTIFDGVTSSMALAQEEIFGPVLAIMEASDVEDAIRCANDTKFGLSASIFTTNIAQAMRFIEKMEVGMIKVNAETAGVEYHAPFGGLKNSSSYSREQGKAAIEFFTYIQTVSISS